MVYVYVCLPATHLPRVNGKERLLFFLLVFKAMFNILVVFAVIQTGCCFFFFCSNFIHFNVLCLPLFFLTIIDFTVILCKTLDSVGPDR